MGIFSSIWNRLRGRRPDLDEEFTDGAERTVALDDVVSLRKRRRDQDEDAFPTSARPRLTDRKTAARPIPQRALHSTKCSHRPSRSPNGRALQAVWTFWSG